MNEEQVKPWFKNWWGVMVAILILPFFVVWYVWTQTGWKKSTKWIITGVVAVVSIISFAQPGDTTSTQTNSNETQNQVAKLNYEITDKRFEGTTANITVVTAEIEADKLIAINDEVFNKYKSGKTHVFINYFDDRTIALSYFDKIADPNTSEAESKALFKHYIANMKYNESSGLKKLFKNDGGDNWTDIKNY